MTAADLTIETKLELHKFCFWGSEEVGDRALKAMSLGQQNQLTIALKKHRW